jgi:Cu+-exporting ATPase
MLLAMPLGAEMGALDNALHALRFPGSMRLPAGSVDVGGEMRWSLLVHHRGRCGVGRARHLCQRHSRAAPRLHQHEHAGEPGNQRGLRYSAYATIWPADGRQVYFDAVLLIVGFLLLGKALKAAPSGARWRRWTRSRACGRSLPGAFDGVQAVVPLEEIQPGRQRSCPSRRALPGGRNDSSKAAPRWTSRCLRANLPAAARARRPRAGRLAQLRRRGHLPGAVAGRATVLAQITRMVEQAQSSRAPMERLADRASAIFVPVVLALAVHHLCVWLIAAHRCRWPWPTRSPFWWSPAPAPWAWPCPRRSPLPWAAARNSAFSSKAARRWSGSRTSMSSSSTRPERSPWAGRCWQGFISLGRRHEENDLLRMAAAAEERSNHPLAHAILDQRAESLGLTWQPAEDVQIFPGRGLSAHGRRPRMPARQRSPLPRVLHSVAPRCASLRSRASRGCGWRSITCPVGYFDARDALRPDAAEAIAALRPGRPARPHAHRRLRRRRRAHRASGGNHEVEAGLDPAGKLARIRACKKRPARGHGGRRHQRRRRAGPGRCRHRHGHRRRPGPGGGRRAAAARATLRHSRAAPGPPRCASCARTWAGPSATTCSAFPWPPGLLYPAFHILLTPWLAAAAMALSSVCVLGNSLRLRVGNLSLVSAGERLPIISRPTPAREIN